MKNIYFCAEKHQIKLVMKRLTIIMASLLMLVTLKLNAQNERLLLLESFTNTGCVPCAQYNPTMDALIANNLDKVVAIKYHVNWPSSSDPMYLHNTAENGARTNYYNVTSVPHVVVDGNRFTGNSGTINQSIIDQLQTLESPYELRLSYELDEASNTIIVHVLGRTSSAIEGNLRLYVAVIEKEIHFNSAPGPNGERDFYDVMKKFLPSSSGTSLGSVEAGDYFAYTFKWEWANVYNVDQLDVIAWVQNYNTKDVYQACRSSESVTPYYANEAAVSNISNMKKTNCSGEAEPKVVLSNNGSNTLNAAELEVFVNDELLKTVNWSGNLATFESTTVDLGGISFPVEDENTLEVKIKSINGGDDEASNNDLASFGFKGSPETIGKVLKLTIRTDANPQETTWKITNLSTGEVVLEGGPYEQPTTMYTETIEITGDGCYDFTIYDAGGNGFGTGGLYGMKAGSTTLFSGNSFGDSESNEFSYEVTADANEYLDQNVSIYPNPTDGLLNIISQDKLHVSIYNMAGQCVYEGYCEGSQKIDMRRFGSGVYAVKVGSETQRVVVK